MLGERLIKLVVFICLPIIFLTASVSVYFAILSISPTDLYLLFETQIELTIVNTLLENIIERPPLKVGPKDVAEEY